MVLSGDPCTPPLPPGQNIYRTHDGGRTWTHIADGIPDGAPVKVVREDPRRTGLLYAGTGREAYVSFDDGEHWQSLRLNMPATSMRDLVVKNDDLIVATHGGGFWILDDVTPLRQLDLKVAEADAFLFKPQAAWRVRWNTNSDTPIPPDEATGQNPPEGAIINYTLKSAASGPVALEILDGAGRLVRRYSSTDQVERPDPATAPVLLYWYGPPQGLSTAPGMHRFQWDLHDEPLPGGGGGRGGSPGPGPAGPGLAGRGVAIAGEAPAGGGRGGGRGGAGGPGGGQGALAGISGSLTSLMGLLQGADVAPTVQLVAAVTERQLALGKLKAQWAALRTVDLAAVNAELKKAGLPAIRAGGPGTD